METPEQLQTIALQEASEATSTASLREVELKYLGKNGSILGLMKQLGSLAKEDRPAFGQRVNTAKATVEAFITERGISTQIGRTNGTV